MSPALQPKYVNPPNNDPQKGSGIHVPGPFFMFGIHTIYPVPEGTAMKGAVLICSGGARHSSAGAKELCRLTAASIPKSVYIGKYHNRHLCGCTTAIPKIGN